MQLPNLKRNISGLFLLHFASFILTFAAIPYLTRVLGLEGWGKLVFVQITISYLCWVTNWGYYLGGTKSVAASRSDSAKINKIYSSILTSQILITILVSSIFVCILFNSSLFRDDLYLYLSGMLVVFGNAIMHALRGGTLTAEAIINLCCENFALLKTRLFNFGNYKLNL